MNSTIALIARILLAQVFLLSGIGGLPRAAA